MQLGMSTQKEKDSSPVTGTSLSKGAQSLCCGLWQVSLLHTGTLTTGFYPHREYWSSCFQYTSLLVSTPDFHPHPFICTLSNSEYHAMSHMLSLPATLRSGRQVEVLHIATPWLHENLDL